MSYDLEPGEQPDNTYPTNGDVAVKNGISTANRGYSTNSHLLEELTARALNSKFDEGDAAKSVYKGQIEILRTECESQSRKIQELNAEISRTKTDSADELVTQKRKYEDEISKLKDELSELKSTHRDTVADLKDEVRKLEFEKNHSSTWMDRIMDNAPEVIPLLQKLFNQPSSALQLPDYTAQPISQNTAQTATEPQKPMNDEPQSKEALAGVILTTAQSYSAGQLDSTIDYAAAIDGMVNFGKAKGWAFTPDDYVSLAEKMIDFAVKQQIEPKNVANAIYPFFAALKMIKVAAKNMSVDQITNLVLVQASIDPENYPDTHLTMFKAVLTQLKTLL